MIRFLLRPVRLVGELIRREIDEVVRPILVSLAELGREVDRTRRRLDHVQHTTETVGWVGCSCPLCGHVAAVGTGDGRCPTCQMFGCLEEEG